MLVERMEAVRATLSEMSEEDALERELSGVIADDLSDVDAGRLHLAIFDG